jgi:GT2 family glycosyltransferase
MEKQVTVIVVNWNGKSCLMQCLAALQMQSFQYPVTVVVDNGSDDGSVEAVRQRFPEVILIALTANLGFAAANNIAIRQADTEYIALLNNDAIAHPLWLETLMAALAAYPEAGSAASKMLYHDTPHVIDRAGDGYTTAGAAFLRGRGQKHDNFNQPEWVFGACAGAALYRMSMLRDIGLLDEDFFLLYEDVDLSFRAQLRGYKCLYVPTAVVYHMVTRSIGYDSPVSVYYGHRNLEWVYAQNMPASLMVRTFARHVLYVIIAFGFFASKGLAVAYIRSKRDCFRVWRTVLNKRKHIQARRRVEVDYIWNLLDTESSISRLMHRIKRRTLKDRP